jgi:hypothetical protein
MSERDKSKTDDKPKIQGEGDYESARRYRRDVEDYVKSADIERAAREAEPDSPEQARELEQAEEIGKSHAKGRKKREKRADDRSHQDR